MPHFDFSVLIIPVSQVLIIVLQFVIGFQQKNNAATLAAREELKENN